MTAIFAAIFMINSLCLTYLFQRDARAQPASLLDKVPVSSTAPAPVAPIDANAVPVPATAPAAPAPAKP
jgi:preprotein translocase subunit SecG